MAMLAGRRRLQAEGCVAVAKTIQPSARFRRPSRRAMLEAAGIPIEVCIPDLDERCRVKSCCRASAPRRSGSSYWPVKKQRR